jgi:tetratricopeptide (TPR) repeat protein
MWAEGQLLDHRYSLLRRLGRGGMAEVWLVEERDSTARRVAKLASADAPRDSRLLLEREYRTLRRLEHPNIVRAHEFGSVDEHSYLILDYVEGADAWCLRGLPPSRILGCLIPVADALEHAHARGVIHRDIKPGNCLIDADANPHLLDFGVAGLPDPEPSGWRMEGGGTPTSMSPQQRGGCQPHPSDDVYSFGIMLRELTAGPSLPAELSELLARMLDPDPANRPSGMAAVKQQLQSLMSSQGWTDSAPPPQLTPPPRVPMVRSVHATSPSAGTSLQQAKAERRRPNWLPAALVILLFTGLLGAFVVLPRWVAERDQAKPDMPPPTNRRSELPERKSEPAGEPRRSADAEQQQAYEPQAEQALRDVISRSRRLEQMDVKVWGGPDWATVREQTNAADLKLRAHAYREAAEAYERISQQLEQLQARSRLVLTRALQEGDRALRDGDAGAASGAFQLAATIAPEDPAAKSGLKRATVLDRVREATEQGAVFERRAELDRAAESYRQALTLDPLDQAARTALARVESAIRERRFAAAMSRGLQALDDRQWEQAVEAFQAADRLQPDSRQVKDGLARAEAGRTLEAIASHREQAEGLEQQEDWAAAAEQYEAALALDPTLVFARGGRSRTRRREQLAARLEYHLQNPGRLSSPEVAAEAEAVLEQADAAAPAGPEHLRQTARLRQLLTAATTPVTVWLYSDAQTEVTVYRVGRLGSFAKHSLQLKPGTYTVVGSREGYRDVRHTLVVAPGHEPAPLLVRCEEAI